MSAREAKLAARRQKYLEQRESRLAYAAKYREENREKIKAATAYKNAEYVRRYRERHPERSRAQSQAWKDAHPEQRKATNAAWTRNNLPKHRTYQHNRRAKVRQCGGKLSPDLSQKLFALQKGRCACCGKKLGKSFEMDHIMPLHLGGPNVDSNIQLLTVACNRKKKAMHPVAYMQAKGKLL